jgi:hypothetical protein
LEQAVKKILLAMAVMFSLVLLPAGVASANSSSTEVSGKVTLNHHRVRHAEVTVTCNGHSRTTTTDWQGNYSVKFWSGQCNQGDTITVTASKGSASGENTYVKRRPRQRCDYGSIYINVALEDVSVPEFGPAEVITAALVAGGTFFMVRRRSLQD